MVDVGQALGYFAGDPACGLPGGRGEAGGGWGLLPESIT